MVIREEIRINAPLAIVWFVFSRMEEWDQWNTACRECCYSDGSSMNTDTSFSFKITPLIFPIIVKPTIVKCEPGKEVIWKGGRFGVQAEHVFQFFEESGSVRLLSMESFKGPLLVLGRLFRIPQRLHRLTGEMMQGIKAHAESCAA